MPALDKAGVDRGERVWRRLMHMRPSLGTAILRPQLGSPRTAYTDTDDRGGGLE